MGITHAYLHDCLSKQELQALLSGLIGSLVLADQPLMEAGLDSIGAVELRNAVSAKFGVELPATVTFDYPTAADLARFVVQRSSPATANSGEQPSATFQAGSYITLDKHSENRAIWKATCFD